jgi:hypothetical protein
MRPTVTRKPDGTFHCADQDYRLHQDDDHFDVVRVSDGSKMGGFSWRGHAAELDGDAHDPSIVRAIAELMSGPRGLVPLQ